MSDFLGNLVARSLAPEAQIGPRLPAPFEPPQASGIEPGATLWLESEGSAGDQDMTRPAAAPSAAPRTRGRPQPAVPPPGDRSLPDDATGPAPYRGRQILPGAPLSVETVAADAAPESLTPPGPVQPLPEPRADGPAAPEAQRSTPVKPTASRRETLPQETESPAAQALTTRERVPIVARPQMRLAQPTEPVPAEGEHPAPSPEPPPTIRVTIGRVEVRAVIPTVVAPVFGGLLEAAQRRVAMSNALAIAAVTAVLKKLLEDWLSEQLASSAVGDYTVTALPPDRVEPNHGNKKAGLNIYLYHTASNPAWRNVDLPSYDGSGKRRTNPPLALDLYYLITAYEQEPLDNEMLLGYAAQLLHEKPALSRQDINHWLMSSSGWPSASKENALKTSGLAEQADLIRLTPHPLSTEEISKLWTAFQAKYRPSLAYKASLVLIESELPTRAVLPVRERRVHVLPMQRPLIHAVAPQFVQSGDVLTLQGQSLRGDPTLVRFGATVVEPPTEDVRDRQIAVTVPADLLAGVQAAQVVHPLDFGTDTEPHRGFESNAVPFMLIPQITTTLPASVAAGGTLTLDFSPSIGRDQAVALLIGDHTIEIPLRDPTGPETSASLDFPIPADFPTGDHLLRVRVDGAESRLLVDEVETSPTYGDYIGPTVTIT
jgi:hypothetical protein